MSASDLLAATTEQLRRAGCVAAEEEAAELIAFTEGGRDVLPTLIERRCQGEPLAWLVGAVQFCGLTVKLHPGVYVPRWQSEPLALAAVKHLPPTGLAVDLCTGSGAIAVVMADRRPKARVVATENEPLALACARDNDVEVYSADLSDGLPHHLVGSFDVVTAVVPYVPTGELRLLPPDTLRYEPIGALDGGHDGLVFLQRAALEAAALLRPGGVLLLELGGDEADRLAPALATHGFNEVTDLSDDEGDLRGVVCLR
jgi:release factor glutamine methyltransferase